MNFDYNAFTNAVIKANKELYEYINTHMTPLDLEPSNTIGFGGDNSLNIDLKAEKLFIKHLQKFGDIFSEEIGHLSSNSNIKIVIDPIDGSHNFQSSLPYYGSSVALFIDNESKAGYVTNLVNASMIFRVDKGIEEISLINEEEIIFQKVSKPTFGVFERAYAYPNICKNLYENRLKFRSPGAAALSLANARNFSFVIFAGKLRQFDIAAANHINCDLFTYQDSDFLIVSKNEQKLLQIKGIIKNNRL